MSWIESHDTLARHPKTKRLARALGANLPQTIGHLHLLWWWSLEYAQDGDLTAFAADELADAALWEGDAVRFVDAMKQAGFLDVTDGAVLIHDWEDYAGKLLQRREANRAKQEAYRNRHKPQGSPPDGGISRDMLPSHIPTITVTSPSRNGATVPNRTVPNQTIQDVCVGAREAEQVEAFEAIKPAAGSIHAAPKPSQDPDARSAFDALITAYPTKNGIPPNEDTAFAAFVTVVPRGDWEAAYIAAGHYAASEAVGRGIVMNLDKWLLQREYRRWQQPEQVSAKKGSVKNDHHTYSDPDAIAAEIARLTADPDVPGDGAQPVPFRRRAG